MIHTGAVVILQDVLLLVPRILGAEALIIDVLELVPSGCLHGEAQAERTGLKRADDGTKLEVETITRDDLLIDVAKVLNLPQIVGALLPIVGGLAEVYIVYTQGDTQEHTVADVGADIEIKGIEGSTSDMQSAVLIIGSLHDIVLKESYGICQAIEGVEVSVGVAIEVTAIIKSLTCQAVQLVCP